MMHLSAGTRRATNVRVLRSVGPQGPRITSGLIHHERHGLLYFDTLQRECLRNPVRHRTHSKQGPALFRAKWPLQNTDRVIAWFYHSYYTLLEWHGSLIRKGTFGQQQTYKCVE